MDSAHPKSSKKKIIILLLLLAVLVGALILIVRNLQKTQNQSPVKNEQTNSEARLSFIPNIIYAKPNQKISSDIVFDAGDAPVQSVTVSVAYNPDHLKDVKVIPYSDPNSALSYSLVALPSAETVTSEGLTVITYKFVSQGTAQKGRGIIAKFSSTVIKSPANIIFNAGSGAVSADSSTNLNVGLVNLNILPDER